MMHCIYNLLNILRQKIEIIIVVNKNKIGEHNKY